MASTQVYYMAMKIHLVNCLSVWKPCLCLDGPFASHFTDTPQCSFTLACLKLKSVQPDNSPASKISLGLGKKKT